MKCAHQSDRRGLREIVVFYTIIAIALCLVIPNPAAASRQNGTALTSAQIEELLDKASALADKYKELFRDLTAEEKRVFELYDKKTGKIEKRRQTVSDLIVYASQQDANRVTEYRNVREVDGKPVKKQFERVEKLFEQVTKADSLGKELDRINRESTRYDFGTQITNITMMNAAATRRQFRQLFKYEFAGRERLRDQELVVIKFEQTEFKKDFIGFHNQSLHYENVTGPLMRGQYWIDPQTGRLWREHNEIFFRDNAQPRTFKATEMDYDFTTGDQGIWLPRRILFRYFNPLKSDKDFPVEMFLSVRIT